MIGGATAAGVGVAALGAATAGGVFFGFSTFVMRGLRDIEPREGLTAMQSINRAAPNPAFMTTLFGTAVLCVGLIVRGASSLDEGWGQLAIAGSVMYLSGVVLTIGYHVPRNDALARISPGSPESDRLWSTYAKGWTAWNHVRTATSLAGAALLGLALRAG